MENNNNKNNLTYIIILMIVIYLILSLFVGGDSKNSIYFSIGKPTNSAEYIVENTKEYDVVMIELPNGEIITGECEKWDLYHESGMVRIVIDDVVYMTHIENVVYSFRMNTPVEE